MVVDIGADIPGAQTGLNSEAFGINDSGQVAFQGETLDPDPNNEDFMRLHRPSPGSRASYRRLMPRSQQ